MFFHGLLLVVKWNIKHVQYVPCSEAVVMAVVVVTRPPLYTPHPPYSPQRFFFLFMYGLQAGLL